MNVASGVILLIDGHYCPAGSRIVFFKEGPRGGCDEMLVGENTPWRHVSKTAAATRRTRRDKRGEPRWTYRKCVVELPSGAMVPIWDRKSLTAAQIEEDRRIAAI